MRDACGWEYCAAWLASMAVWLWLNRNAEWAGLRRLQRVLVRFGLRSADDSGGADGDGTCDDESDGHGRTVRNDGENRDASPRMPTIGAAACVAALRRPYAAEPPWSKRSRNYRALLSQCLN